MNCTKCGCEINDTEGCCPGCLTVAENEAETMIEHVTTIATIDSLEAEVVMLRACNDMLVYREQRARVIANGLREQLEVLKSQKQWRTNALKDAHDDKSKLRAEIHDLKHTITSSQFVKYWEGLTFKQLSLLTAQSLLRAASLVKD